MNEDLVKMKIGSRMLKEQIGICVSISYSIESAKVDATIALRRMLMKMMLELDNLVEKSMK